MPVLFNWEDDLIKQVAYLLTWRISFIVPLREPPCGNNAKVGDGCGGVGGGGVLWLWVVVVGDGGRGEPNRGY